MLRRLAWLLALGALAPAASSAEDRLARDLGKVLAQIQAAGVQRDLGEREIAPLRPLLRALEERHGRRERELDRAARRKLPPKALDRLRRTRLAHRAAMLPLIEILQGIARSPRPEATAARTTAAGPQPADRLGEAREILRRMETASRRQPISAEMPGLRAPSLTPPALGVASGATTATPVGHVPRILKDAAAGLGGPIDIYGWVRSTIDPEFYYGAMKGGVETYLEQSGNDADTAALLIHLLRAKGIPARFSRGTIEVPGATLAEVCGTANVEQAVRVLERGGVPHEVITGAGGVASVKMERIWAEAYLPYANYRGTLQDAQGGTWIPLDPAFKRLAAPNTFDVVAGLGFEPDAAWREYLTSSPEATTPVELVRGRIAQLLQSSQSGQTYDGVLNDRAIAARPPAVLPNSLPYAVSAVTETSYDLPETLTHSVRLVAERDGETVLDAAFPVPRLLGQRLTLSYLPFSDEDEEAVASFGGMTQTPPYLIDVKAVVRLGGVAIAAADAPLGMGVPFTLRTELKTPGGTETVENTLIAGNLAAIGLSGRQVTASEATTDRAASILADLAGRYFDRWNASDDELARLFKVVPVRPTISACLVTSVIDVEYAGGDPLYPLTFDWKAILIDADLRSSAPVGIAGRDTERPFTLISGLEGSVLEHRVFEDKYQVKSISTAKAVGLAAEAGLAVHEVTAANADAILPTLELDEQVIGEVRAAVERGWVARIPAAPLAYIDWTGVGYVLLDEATGEGAYQLQGGHSGGMTAPAVIDLPQDLTEPLIQQREDPADARGRDVAHVYKWTERDLQEGTVNKTLGLPLKVYVTDAEGFAVEGAQVVFSVVGGGGRLVDLQTGDERTTVETLSDATGAATVGFRLGKLTSEMPRFTCEAGYSCDNVTSFATQVGLNMVTAQTGAAILDEPFYAFGYPDLQYDGKSMHAYFSVKTNASGGWGVNLRVAGLVALGWDDQYGNPISNLGVNLNYRHPPELADPKDGWVPGDGSVAGASRCRNEVPDNPDTPGGVLTATEYAKCAERSLPVRRSDCPGSASATVPTSALGGALYPVIGDSPYSIYRFDSVDAEGTKLLDLWYSTAGPVCPFENPEVCGCLEPEAYATAFTRPAVINGNGDVIEAYPPTGQARMGFATDAIYEKERIEKVTDANGVVHFFAYGTNQWVRESLDDSTFEITPVTTGTTAGRLSYVSGGRYEGPLAIAPVPQRNTVNVTWKLYPPEVPYLPGRPSVAPPPGVRHEVDPGQVYVDPISGSASLIGRVKDRARPWTGGSAFSLWGVRPRLGSVEPAPVRVTEGGVVLRDSRVLGTIEPPGYEALLDSRHVAFDLTRANAPILSATGLPSAGYAIPTGMKLAAGTYSARVSISGVNPGDEPLISAPLEVVAAPPCKLLSTDKQPNLTVSRTSNPWDGTSCPNGEALRFDLCEDAIVTLTVGGKQLQSNIVLPAGPQSFPISAAAVDGLPAATAGNDKVLDYVLEARAALDPTNVARATGKITLQERCNRSVLPVGRTFVKGVDLFDGHLVRQATDLTAPGRHLGLEVTRTYSSSGQDPEGLLGAGWTFNFESALIVSSCGIVVVRTPDGSSQAFRSLDGGASYEPQPGYHTRLVEGDAGSFDFYDKAHVRYHYAGPEAQGATVGTRRLLYVEEPHGDRLLPTYDPGTGRLIEVGEYPKGASTPVQRLAITYRKDTPGGYPRIQSLAIPELRLEVSYDYDEWGNLTRVTRSGRNVLGAPHGDSEPREESYGYSVGEVRDRHQLVRAVDANGHHTDFIYFTPADQFPGEASGEAAVLDKEEHVRIVLEFAQEAAPADTIFEYDHRDVLTQERRTRTVTDPRGEKTVYALDLNGSPVEIQPPSGPATTMGWHTDDIYKDWEQDANERRTEYLYDENGNLTLETIHTGDASIVGSQPGGDVTTTYEYDATFNKLKRKTDALDHSTFYDIDTVTGDLLGVKDAADNETRHQYTPEGLLWRTTDPRRNTITYSDWDRFGTPRRDSGPGNYWKQRETDDRGRVTREWDSLGHETQTEYDGFDRPVVVRKLSGNGQSADNVTRTWYYPAGQVSRVVNALGAETKYTLDGLNRVRRAETTVPQGRAFTVETTYDENGNKAWEKDARGVERRYIYDDLNRLRRVEIVSSPYREPVGPIAEYDYDFVANKTGETNLARLRTAYEYDRLYRVRKKIFPRLADGNQYSETYVNDAVGNRRELWDANQKRTAFQYDKLNRLTATTNALSHETLLEYNDPEGSHVNKSLEHDTTRGLRTTFAYDELNRETRREVHLDGPAGGGRVYATATAYNPVPGGQQVTIAGEDGHVTERTLDGLDRVVSETVHISGPDSDLVTQTTYDGLGNKTSVIDPRGHETRFGYDGLGRQIWMQDALGVRAYYDYDEGGLKLTETDRRGVERAFAYDSLGRLTESHLTSTPFSGVGWSHRTEYRDLARRRIEYDARGASTVYDLDAMDRVVVETDAEGGSARYHYDGVNKNWEIDKRGKRTHYTYDAINRLVLTQHPGDEKHTTETDYQDRLNIRRDKDRRNLWTRAQLDPLGRVVRLIRENVDSADVDFEVNDYDAYGNKTLAGDAEGHQTRFSYDGANRLTGRVDGAQSSEEASATRYVHQEKGGILLEIDARAQVLGLDFSTRKTFDELNRLATVTDGENHTTTYDYDEEGNRTHIREPEGQETVFAFDELGKLRTATQPEVPGAGGASARPVTTYRYDRNRNRIAQVDAENHTVEMSYDGLNRLTMTTQDPGGLNLTTAVQSYDGNGNVVDLVDPKGQLVHNTYDDLNRLIRREYHPANAAQLWRHTTAIDYDYDGNGNLERATEHVATSDAPGTLALTTMRAYDAFDRLTSETAPGPGGTTTTVGYDYYRNGTRKSVTDPRGRVTFYTYDAQNRLKAATTDHGVPALAKTTSYAYSPDSLLDTVTYPNGVQAKQTYDNADRLLGIANSNGATPVSSYTYTYTPNGNRLSQVEANGGLTETTRYTYDALNRIETITYPGDRHITYDYDLVGNRRFETETDSLGTVVARQEGVFDAANRLTQLVDHVDANQSAVIMWDNNGNQTSKTIGSGETAVTTLFRYEARDKLVEAQQGGDIPAQFAFAFDGRRVLKRGADGPRQYVFDQTSILSEYGENSLTHEWFEVAKYDYGSDRLISLTHNTEGRHYYSFDALRSVTNLTSDLGATTASYHLDAWGNFRFPTELTSSANRFAFTGYQWDQETGLYNAKARFYDPTLGRFISQDSYLGDISDPPSLHRFTYANDNPTRYIDPTGHYSWSEFKDEAKWWGSFAVNSAVIGYSKGAEVTANLATFGGYGSGKAAHERGEGALGVAQSTFAGTANTVSLGLLGGMAEGLTEKDVTTGGILKGSGGGVGKFLLPIEEGKAALDSRLSLADRLEAGLMGAAKIPATAALALGVGTELTIPAAPGPRLGQHGVNLANPKAVVPAGPRSSTGAAVLSEGRAVAEGPVAAPVEGVPPVDSLVNAPRSRVAGPSEGFGRYVEAEGRVSRVPLTEAEAEDALRMNAAVADLGARAAGTPRQQGRFGTEVHVAAERSAMATDQAMRAEGSAVSIGVEEFRFPSSPSGGPGALAPRRAATSKGVDGVVYVNGVPVRGFDIKTGRSWSAKELAEIEARFGIPVTQIRTK